MSLFLMVVCYLFLVIPVALMMIMLIMVPVVLIGSGILILLISYTQFVAKVERNFQPPSQALDYDLNEMKQAS